MRNFTRFFCTAFLLMAGFVGASAQEDEIIDFDASFYHNWSEVSATATDNGEVEGGGVVIGEEVAIGGTIWGNLTGAVPYLCYANITEYSELRFEGTPGATIRLMCNRVIDEGAIYEIKPTFDENGKIVVPINDLKFLPNGDPCNFVCLQSIKVPASWAGGTMAATITSIKIVKPGDPLANYKTDLKNALNHAKLQSPFAKTEASFAALQKAIADGEAALASATDATTLETAKADIEAAEAGLTLAEGYSDLTKEMFFSWTGWDASAVQGDAAYCEYTLFKSTGQPYGDPSVNNFADLSGYDKLQIVSTGGTPRFLFNRDADGGQWNEDENESHLIDNTRGGWSAIFFSQDGDVYTVDLAKLVALKGYAHLHAIKASGNVTVSGMYLYKEEAAATTKTIALVPGPWAVDNATYAVYAFNSDEDNAWFPFVEVSGTYATQIPVSYAKIIVVRLKPATDETYSAENNGLNWNNKWNQTGDIDFTTVADNSIIAITDWGENDYIIATALEIAKTKLQNAINAVSAYGISLFDDAIAAAQAAVNAENATVESLEAAATTFEATVNAYLKVIITMAISMDQTLKVGLPAELISNAAAVVANENATTQELASAMFALLNTAQPYVKELLQQAVELATAFGIDTTEAQALLDKTNPEATTIEMYPVLQSLATAAMAPAHKAMNTLKNFMETFDSAANEVLAEDLAKLGEDFDNMDIAAVKVDIKTLMEKGKPYLLKDMAKLEGYAQVMGNEAITADVAAMKNAVEAEDFLGLFAALKQFEADFLAAAPRFVEQIKFAAAGYKDAGKTNAMEQLEAAIAAAEQALGAEEKDIVAVGLAIRNLIVAVRTHLAANSTYTIAGTKDLTGTENDWDIVEANNMTKSAEDYMYEWTAQNITVTAENQPQFKVVIKDIDGTNQTWIPASEEGDDHNWVITPELETLDGPGIYTITITFNAKTQEIGVTGVKTGGSESHLYVIGDGNSWSRTEMEELTLDDATQTYTYVVETEKDFYFAFADYQQTEEEAAADANWETFNNTYRYAIEAGDQTPELNAEYQLSKVNGTIKLAAGKYIVTVTKDLKMTITDATLTGISALNADSQNAVVYNLAGQRVKGTKKGLFIVNGKKIMVK